MTSCPNSTPHPNSNLYRILFQITNQEKQTLTETTSQDPDAEDEEDLEATDVDEKDIQLLAEEKENQLEKEKIVEVDRVIAEKEEILNKLQGTLRGYSAMKVGFFVVVNVRT
jgi:hypothetical protein